MVIFHSYVNVYQRVNDPNCPSNPYASRTLTLVVFAASPVVRPSAYPVLPAIDVGLKQPQTNHKIWWGYPTMDGLEGKIPSRNG